MTARVGAAGVEVLYQGSAPPGPARVGAAGVEVLYRETVPDTGRVVWAGSRKRRRIQVLGS